eukprot:363893-Chlamydomonas_euryale.AAC.1
MESPSTASQPQLPSLSALTGEEDACEGRRRQTRREEGASTGVAGEVLRVTARAQTNGRMA